MMHYLAASSTICWILAALPPSKEVQRPDGSAASQWYPFGCWFIEAWGIFWSSRVMDSGLLVPSDPALCCWGDGVWGTCLKLSVSCFICNGWARLSVRRCVAAIADFLRQTSLLLSFFCWKNSTRPFCHCHQLGNLLGRSIVLIITQLCCKIFSNTIGCCVQLCFLIGYWKFKWLLPQMLQKMWNWLNCKSDAKIKQSLNWLINIK